MPIIDVQVVQPPSQPLDEGLAQRLADTIGLGWHAEPGHVWVRLHTLGADRYAENQNLLRDDELPVMVTVLLRELPASQDRAAHAAALASTIAAVVARPVHRVHIEYAVPGRERLAFGGRFSA